MAQRRKHGVPNHERLLASFRYAHGLPASAADLPDLGEADVWAAVAPDGDTTDGDDGWYGDSFAWQPSGANDRRSVGGLSLAFDGGGGGGTARPPVVHGYRDADGSSAWGGSESRCHHHGAASAPVTVPAWPRAHHGGTGGTPPGAGELDGGGCEWVPPHEYLAREYAAAGGGLAAARSVFERAGRTLKGRDLRRLRDAVWSQTGFDG